MPYELAGWVAELVRSVLWATITCKRSTVRICTSLPDRRAYAVEAPTIKARGFTLFFRTKAQVLEALASCLYIVVRKSC